MAKLTVICLLASTGIVLVAFGKGMGVLQGGEVASHLNWAVAALLSVLVANCFAAVHVLQSARIIRELRRYIESLAPQDPSSPQ